MVGDVLGAVAALGHSERLGAMITVLSGPDSGSAVVVDRISGVTAGQGKGWLTADIRSDADDLMDREESKALVYGDWRVFIDTIAPPPVLLMFGAGHIAQSLAQFAKGTGFRVVVADARADWATPERFADVDELIVAWPERVFEHIDVDMRTYVVLLSHDSRFETPVFNAVHDKSIRYLGALGSRRTHALRVERLLAGGWSDAEIDCIHGPIGLDLKARTPAETAISILAEMIQVRYGAGTGPSLRESELAIHVD
jgi:xanthine dehydrogenase accessory factor